MEYMNWVEVSRIGGCVVAAGSGVVHAGASVLAQVTPGNVSDVATSIGTGTVFVGMAGLITAISAALKPVWEDRRERRQLEKEKYQAEMESRVKIVRYQTHDQRRNWLVTELYEWSQKVSKLDPRFPSPPDWTPISIADQRNHEDD